MELTHILVVSDLGRSIEWYRDVLSAALTGEHGGTLAVFNFQGAWLLVVTGGPETADKPATEFAPPADRLNVSFRDPDGHLSSR